MASMDIDNGWDESAEAWIASVGESGDWGRRNILDAAMLGRIGDRTFASALDVGCGEGRFCRMLKDRGIPVVGIDPTEPLLDQAANRDPAGDYRLASAENLPFEDGKFDLVVTYLTLIDIPDYKAAIQEMRRVLAPGGTLLVANLTSMCTAGVSQDWITDADGNLMHWPVDRYLEEYDMRLEWSGIRVVNWHRPLSAYMAAFLGSGLQLVHYDEPVPISGEPERVARYLRMPWFVVMEWTLPK